MQPFRKIALQHIPSDPAIPLLKCVHRVTPTSSWEDVDVAVIQGNSRGLGGVGSSYGRNIEQYTTQQSKTLKSVCTHLLQLTVSRF